MNYNDSITKTLEGTNKIKKCIESCHTVEQFNCMQNMLNGLCSMCNMWSAQLNRKDRIKYNYFAKIAVDEVVELGKTWTERYNQYKKDYEDESPIVRGFSEIFYSDEDDSSDSSDESC